MEASHVSPLWRCLIGGLLYIVQMFSCAISWLFFKWLLSQGKAGQYMETSALTIFLSKQQMASLLSFWSGTQIPIAEVLFYIDAVGASASPNSSTVYRCFLGNSFLVCFFLWLDFCGVSWTLALPPGPHWYLPWFSGFAPRPPVVALLVLSKRIQWNWLFESPLDLDTVYIDGH